MKKAETCRDLKEDYPKERRQQEQKPRQNQLNKLKRQKSEK